MAELSAVERSESWRRRLDQWMLYVPYVALAASAVLVPVGAIAGLRHQPYPVIAALSVLTAAWLFWWVTLHPSWQGSRPRMTVFFLGLLVLIASLAWCSSLFGFFAWTGYLFVGYALKGRITRLTGCTAVAVLTATAQAGGIPAAYEPGTRAYFAVLLLFNVVIANTLTFVSTISDEQSERRAKMIDELAQANAKLAAALKENEGLHAQLLVQAREAGVLDERQRMAGEIHDVLAQGLTGIVTQLEAVDAAAEPVASRRHLEAAKGLARESLAEARRSVQALRPQTLDNAALPEAIDEIAAGWSQLHDVPASLVTTGTPRSLLPEIETTLLRTAQEALANVARHAAARRVILTLSYMEDVVTLDVRDDGTGFDPSHPPEPSAEGGYGLAAMRERLLRIAGTLSVESEPGAGTALSACVPAIAIGAAA